MLLRRLLRRGDRDELHFGELVLADHPARVLAGSACFRPETGGASGETHGQRGFVDDRFADKIGQRNFGGGNEPPSTEEHAVFDQGVDDFEIKFLLELVLECFFELFLHLRCIGVKLVVLKFGKLPGPEHNLVAHEDRRIDLGVAMLAGMHIQK